MIRTAIVTLALALGVKAAAADFVMDMSERDIRGALGFRTVADLTAGETASARSLQFCSAEGSLFVIASARLEEGGANTVVMSVTREGDGRLVVLLAPGGAVAKQPEPGEEYRKKARQIIQTGSRPCENWAAGPDYRLPVRSINGFDKMSDLLDSVR